MDELFMWQVNELLDYWHINPPVHMLAKMWTGYEPADTHLTTEAEARELASWFANEQRRN